MWADFADDLVRGEIAIGREGFRFVLFRDGRLPVKLVEPDVAIAGTLVRGPGLWVEVLTQRPDEHYTIDLESYALEVDDLADDVGHRVALGLELEWEVEAIDPDGTFRCVVHGEVLVGDEAIDFSGSGGWTPGWPPT